MIMGMILSWVLGLGAILMTLGLSVNAIWRAVMPPAGLPRGASCGSCGYELTTLGEGRCSECGAELLKAGVATRRTTLRTSGSLPAALMGWTILVISIWSVGFGIVISALAFNVGMGGGGTQTVVNTQSFRPDRFDAMGTGSRARSADYEITFVYDGEFNWGGGASAGTLTIEVEGDDVVTPFLLDYDTQTEGFTITGADGVEISSGVDFDAVDAEGLLALAGLDVQHPGLAVEADQVGEIFDAVLDDPANFETTVLFNNASTVGGLSRASGTTTYGNPMGMGNNSSTEMIIVGVVVGVGGLIYIAGIVFLVRRRSRLLMGPRASSASSV